MEFCPNCGEFVKSLNDYTGWCRQCSASLHADCEVCGNPTNSRKVCRDCSESKWMEVHADAIDTLLARGYAKTAAIKLIRDNKEKPRCRICGGEMRRATGNRVALFCNSNAKCRSAKAKFRRLLYHDRLSREEALEKVLYDYNRTNGNSVQLHV